MVLPQLSHRAKRLSCQNVKVQMGDLLAGVRSLIYDHSVSGAGYAVGLGQRPGRREHLTEHGVEARGESAHVREVLVGDNQQVDRGLGGDIGDGEAVLISVEDVGSGVDSESVLLTVNGTPVDASFDPVHHRVVLIPRGAWDGVDQMLRLRLTDLAGNETIWERRIDLQTLMPQAAQFQLEQNFPNPFNPETTIRFDVPGAVDFRLVIYNLLGQEIRTLMAGRFESGRYTVSWDAKDDLGRQVAAGMYLYRLEARDVVLTRKMVLVK